MVVVTGVTVQGAPTTSTSTSILAGADTLTQSRVLLTNSLASRGAFEMVSPRSWSETYIPLQFHIFHNSHSIFRHDPAAVAQRDDVHSSWPPGMVTNSAHHPGCSRPLRNQAKAARPRDVLISTPDT